MIYVFWAAFDPPHAGHAAIIRALLHFQNPEKILVIPSGPRNDKVYNISNEHRIALCEQFVRELSDERVILDTEFITWEDEMITKDVDQYVQKKYGSCIHIFGTDTISSMPDWDEEWYAARKISKIFIPRKGYDSHIPETIELSTLFQDSHFPDISSTAIRQEIREEYWKHIHHSKDFVFSWLSKRISSYILAHKLYYEQPKVREKLLVHVCCGPDVTMPILELRDEYDIVCFWYDPNIQPKEEHDKRFEAFKQVCEIEHIPFIKWAYDVKNFFQRIRWLEDTPEKWEKCTNCYDMRMYVSAKLAARLWFRYYTSSLNTSPKKDLEKLFSIGHQYAKRYNLTFLDIPFRKWGGFERSVEYTKEHNIYRQNYCGCVYSIREKGRGG